MMPCLLLVPKGQGASIRGGVAAALLADCSVHGRRRSRQERVPWASTRFFLCCDVTNSFWQTGRVTVFCTTSFSTTDRVLSSSCAMAAATFLTMIFKSGKPQFSASEAFPLTDASMDFDDSLAVVLPHARRTVDAGRAGGRRTNAQKWLIALSLVGLYLVAALVFQALGMVQPRTLYVLSGLIVGLSLVFWVAFKSGLHMRAHEKRLKLPIVVSALACMLVVVYLDPAMQILLAPFSFVAIAYGMYRIPRRTAFLVAWALLSGYAVVIALHYMAQQNDALLRLEVLHFVALAVSLPSFIYLVGKVQMLQRILHRASRKIKNIQEDAQRDTLLGCFNRRYILAALEEQKQLADESGIPLCLAVLDIDHFKRINDELGHLGGDEVLRTFARIAQQGVRGGDVFGRYGGKSSC